MHGIRIFVAMLWLALLPVAQAQSEKMVEIPTRPGVTQRLSVIATPGAKAAVILFSGGDGGLQIGEDGQPARQKGNFLVRTRQSFAAQGLFVVMVDAPSDRQAPPFLQGFRQSAQHVADVKAVIAWTRSASKLPVWLIGTSRGTQSVGFAATELSGADGPDGIVLSSTILIDDKGRPVPDMPLDRLHIPVLVQHHEQDGCPLCAYSQVPGLMRKLQGAPRSELQTFGGGRNRGDPCEAMAYHGFNGVEDLVVRRAAEWITAAR
ncbi:MAG: alpha/beta hydrolase [Rhodocyclaceae bacterium]